MPPSKYLAIAEDLRGRCRKLPPGTRLPSEKELAAEYGVSRMTLRQATDVLVGERVVSRVVGSGTFTRTPVVTKGTSLTSFTEDMRQRGLEPSSRLIGFERQPASAEVVADLGLHDHEDVLVIERLRLADAEPICLEVAQLPWRFHASFTPDWVEQSLHQALLAIGVRLTSGTRVIRGVVLAHREAMLLQLRPGDPALQVVHVFFDDKGRPVQRARSLYRADRYEIVTEIRRTPVDPTENQPGAIGPVPLGE
jgi:GntR family transcriptional regulator